MNNNHGGDIYKYRNILDFSTNINPLGTPENIKSAIVNSIDDVYSYPDMYCSRLRKKIAEKYNIDREYVVCGNGAADIIYRFASALNPKKALIVSPTFSEYQEALENVGCDVTHYVLGYDLMLDKDVLNYIDSDISAVFICNPNNPTGMVADSDIIDKLIELTFEKDIKLFVDECFLDFTKFGQNSVVDKVERFDNIFVLKSFTKMYAMAGVRLGYGITSDLELIDSMYSATPPWSVSTVAQNCGIASFVLDDFVDKTIKLIDKEKQFLYNGLEMLDIHYFKSDANFILFKSVPGLKNKLLKQGILIRDCSDYVGLERGFYRISVKTRKENEILLEALNCALNKIF